MGHLAVIGLKFEHGKEITDTDIMWLMAELSVAQDTIREYEEAMDQRGHVIELTDIGFGIEHTIECRKNGILNCPIHLHMERELERGTLDALDDGRYFVELSSDGKISFKLLEGYEEGYDESD